MATVEFNIEARRDLRAYRAWLRKEAGRRIADRWIEALLDWIEKLRDFPDLGTPRPDLRAALRTRVFRRSVTIAYVSVDGRVTVLRVLARGRDLTAELFSADR